jgi:hypothetical protein
MKTIELKESEALTVKTALSKYREHLLDFYVNNSTSENFKFLALEEMKCIDLIIEKL